MDTSILKELGLIESEIKVYLDLLKRGQSLASDIAKSTGLHRTHTYDILKSLIKKSIIVHTIRENRKYFQAVTPDKLFSLLKTKEDELKESQDKLNNLISELQTMQTSKRPDVNVFVYEGAKGFKTLLEDILKQKENYLVIGYNPTAEEKLKYFLPSFYLKRRKAKIRRKAIVDPSFRGSWVEKQKFQEIKFLKYSFPMGIIIYGNRVVMTVILETGQVAIVIENKKFSDNFRLLFDDMWKQAKP